MALVRLSATADQATAVSQDGTVVSGFNLGVRTDSCGTANGLCFNFEMANTDSSVPLRTRVLSSTPVDLDRWYHLTGVYNAGTDRLELYVCDLGPDDDRFPLPEATPASFTTITDRSWTATGPFRVGRAVEAGQTDHEWPGLIDDVQAFAGATNQTGANRACNAERN